MLLTLAVNTFEGAQSLAALLAVLFKAILLTLVVCGAVALVVVAWPVIQQVFIAAPLIAAFCWITYPRRKVVR